MSMMDTSRQSEMEISTCSLCNSNNKKLHEKLQDLIIKYEALEHKFNTTKLESLEYEKQVDELQQENEEQRLTINLSQKRLSTDILPISPIIQLRMSGMEDQISADDNQIHELQAQINTYCGTIANLKSENSNLQKENENFRKSLILNDKQKQIQQTSLIAHKKEIYSLNIEIERLRDELNTLQTSINSSKSPASSISCFTQSPPRIGDTGTMHLQFTKTPGSVGVSDQSSLHPFQFAALMGFNGRNGSVTDVYGNSNITANNTMDAINEDDILNSYESEDIMILKLKLERLENENKELHQQMEVFLLGNNDEMKFIEEYEEVNEESGSDENVHEMEELFKKCEDGIDDSRLKRNQNFKKRIKGGIEWWVCYENNICPVKVGL